MTVRILIGDCRARLAELPDASVDSVVCDPPYHLTSIVKRFGAENAAPAKVGKTGAYARASKGFMGQQWDGGDVAFRPETWAEVMRVLKPGGHLLAFSGTRTYHRLACAVEDAGFEVRDMISWLYGSGFPKSHNQPGGWGTALKPACEPIVLARKPLIGTVAANVLAHGTGAINVDACRIETEERTASREVNGRPKEDGWGMSGGSNGSGAASQLGRWPANIVHDGSDEVVAGFPAETGISRQGATATGNRRSEYGFGEFDRGEGYGDSGSAARFFGEFKYGEEEWEFVRNGLVARSAASLCGSCETPIAGDPVATLTLGSSSAASQAGQDSIGICERCIPILSRALSAANLESTGTIPTIPNCSKSNGSAQPVTANIIRAGGRAKAADASGQERATRFLYCPKATTEERGEGNNHPTVKPVALMRWLVRLITPKGGTVLDPFMGSGSTLIAADAEQFNAIGCELSPEYAAIAEKRIRDAAGMFADVEVIEPKARAA